jgi:hypothetical protein
VAKTELAELREIFSPPPARPESPATQPSPLAGISLPVAATCPRIEVH